MIVAGEITFFVSPRLLDQLERGALLRSSWIVCQAKRFAWVLSLCHEEELPSPCRGRVGDGAMVGRDESYCQIWMLCVKPMIVVFLPGTRFSNRNVSFEFFDNGVWTRLRWLSWLRQAQPPCRSPRPVYYYRLCLLQPKET